MAELSWYRNPGIAIGRDGTLYCTGDADQDHVVWAMNPDFSIRWAVRERMRFTMEPRLALDPNGRLLEWQLGKPVRDLTGLKGNYEFTLIWDNADLGGRPGFAGRGGMETALNPNAPPPPPPGGAASDGGSPLAAVSDAAGVPTLFGALQSQLGLKLDAKKGPMEVVVVDHAERVPTEN